MLEVPARQEITKIIYHLDLNKNFNWSVDFEFWLCVLSKNNLLSPRSEANNLPQ